MKAATRYAVLFLPIFGAHAFLTESQGPSHSKPFIVSTSSCKLLERNNNQFHRYRSTMTAIFDSHKDDDEISGQPSASSLDTAGIVSQPIVWASLVSVATTGAGLPSGPFGLVGGIEGLAYLIVVGWFGVAIWNSISGAEDDDYSSTKPWAETFSLATVGIGLLVLVKVVVDQGCIPNAKPIFDYSDYVKVCQTQQLPGIFGGGSSLE